MLLFSCKVFEISLIITAKSIISRCFPSSPKNNSDVSGKLSPWQPSPCCQLVRWKVSWLCHLLGQTHPVGPSAHTQLPPAKLPWREPAPALRFQDPIQLPVLNYTSQVQSSKAHTAAGQCQCLLLQQISHPRAPERGKTPLPSSQGFPSKQLARGFHICALAGLLWREGKKARSWDLKCWLVACGHAEGAWAHIGLSRESWDISSVSGNFSSSCNTA